jgi:hypothetical protein
MDVSDVSSGGAPGALRGGWKPVPTASRYRILGQVNSVRTGVALSLDRSRMEQRDLAWLPAGEFYRVTDFDTVPPVEVHFIVYGTENFILDGSAAPIYAAVAAASLRLDGITVRDYLRFFFEHVRGAAHGLRIVECEEDVLFTGLATIAGRDRVRAHLRPIHVSLEKNGDFILDAVAVFRDALFAITVALSPGGSLQIRDDRLLAEGLPIVSRVFAD